VLLKADINYVTILGQKYWHATPTFVEIEMDESNFDGKRKGNQKRGAAEKNPVFGILECGEKVRVEVVHKFYLINTSHEDDQEGETRKSHSY
jgi:hypothetical protein